MNTVWTPDQLVFGLDIGTRSIVGTVGYRNSDGGFVVVAQSVRFHQTRSMLDGQIHDIGRVAETISEVKHELEKKLSLKLTDVCIAAAGRVLKTITIKTTLDIDEELPITDEMIRNMELMGVDDAHKRLREKKQEKDVEYYCVGYTVIHYYLGDISMSNLEGHKSNSIGAEILVTFLPDDVVTGLYAATDRAGLKVANLTLEPIAAINVAIPEKFRLLNLALVDVGAGTSDICITKGGSVVAYGMIPCAGDSLTETIMQSCLVEFNEAENIKMDISSKKKKITYTDIMGIKHNVSISELKPVIEAPVKKLTKEIAAEIKMLNGGKTVSAIFIVGGGGKYADFTKHLAKFAELPAERVALRGEEVLGSVTFLDESIKKDSTLVTPIGICLNYYEQNNNFIFVEVNDERVKLYDNGHLTVMDAAMSVSFPNEKLFPRRGEALNYTIDGKKRMLRGEAGESAVIKINGKLASINSPVVQNDNIVLVESTMGAPASATIADVIEQKFTITFLVNGKKVVCPRLISVNNNIENEFYEIQNEDNIEILDYYTVEKILEYMDVIKDGIIMVNNVPATLDSKVYENFNVDFGIYVEELQKVFDEEEKKEQAKEATGSEEQAQESEPGTAITVNGTNLILRGKEKYIFVDILDHYSFDTSTSHGEEVVMKKNGEVADFTTEISAGDIVELYWK